MDIREHNRVAWDRSVEWQNRWTIPVGPQEVAAARQGHWEIYLTPTKPVPRPWFPKPEGCDVLCLASGGGQQGPILAAAGAHVTVFDNSPRQLAQDSMVARQEGLAIATVEGDMRDLSVFADESFDLIVHPVSNVFVPDARRVWREAFRVLRPVGALLAGFDHPIVHVFDDALHAQGVLQVARALPCSNVDGLSKQEREQHLEKGEFIEFSHTLEEQIGGQIEAGFLIAGFYEDVNPPEDGDLVSTYMPVCIATRAVKLTI